MQLLIISGLKKCKSAQLYVFDIDNVRGRTENVAYGLLNIYRRFSAGGKRQLAV